MKLSRLKTIIQEEVYATSKKHNLHEGVIDNILSMVIDKLVKTKYKKYFDELHNDPEFIDAQRRLKDSLVAIDKQSQRYEKTAKKSESAYNEYAKKYGKKAADKMVADVKAGKYKPSWKKK